MKTLCLLIIACILMSGCQSKKAKLVSLQKQIKDSLSHVDNNYHVNLLIRSVKMTDSFDKFHPDWRRFGLLDDAIKMDTLNYQLQDIEMRKLDSLHFLLKDKYDSLEFEIKKY